MTQIGGESTARLCAIAVALVVIGTLFGNFGSTASGADLLSSGAPPPKLISPQSVFDCENFSPEPTLTPKFEWEEVSGVDRYGLRIEYYYYDPLLKPEDRWVQYLDEEMAGALTSFEPSQGDLDLKWKWGNRYRWRMKSHRANVWGEPSDWSYFWIGIPTPTQETVKGIDVSHHQGEIISPSRWNEVHEAGYEFAFVKATEGDDWTDDNFPRNMENALGIRILMGAYHFARPDLNDDAAAEAEFFVKQAREYLKEGYLRPMLDLERGGGGDKEELSDWVHQWMTTVKNETKGIEPILYVRGNYLDDYLVPSVQQYDLWIPHYGVGELGRQSGFWQYSEEGFVPGISTLSNATWCNVDIDLFYGNRSELENEFVIKHEADPEVNPESSAGSTSDIVLVIDTSGSMDGVWQGETKLRSAKDGTDAFVTPLRQGTTLAVVAFADSAVTHVASTSDFSAAKIAIEALGSGGDTNIGDALTEALGTHSEGDAAKAIVFFTDGHITTGMSEDEVLAGPVQEAIDRHVVIHAIGYGDPSYLHSTFLKEMAESTGGEYYDATEVFQLQNVFIEAAQRAELWDIEATFAGKVKHQETVTAGTFDLASRVGSLKVTLNWPGSNLDLHIIDPRGREVDYQDSRVTTSSDMKPEYVVIERPSSGTWTVKVHGMAVASETEYRLWIATHAAPAASASFPGWLLPLMVCVVVLPILLRHMTRHSR